MSIHNSSIYKIGKMVLKETPQVIEILDSFYAKLQPYSVLRNVRLLMIEIKSTKDELGLAVDSAKKVVKNKGMVNK